MLSVWQNVRADGNVAWHSRSVGVTYYAKTYATHKASALLYFLMTLERRIKVLHKSRVSLYAEAPPLDIHHTVTKLICNLPDSTGIVTKVDLLVPVPLVAHSDGSCRSDCFVVQTDQESRWESKNLSPLSSVSEKPVLGGEEQRIIVQKILMPTIMSVTARSSFNPSPVYCTLLT